MNEEKFKGMEETRTDALEMAKKENERAKASSKTPEMINSLCLRTILFLFFSNSSATPLKVLMIVLKLWFESGSPAIRVP